MSTAATTEARAELAKFLNEQLDGYENDAEATLYLREAFPYDAAHLVALARAAR